jgi:hypothetical protein
MKGGLRYNDHNHHYHKQYHQGLQVFPQDLLANTRTHSLAAQSLFLRLKNASVGFEVSTCAGKVIGRDFRLPPRCK